MKPAHLTSVSLSVCLFALSAGAFAQAEPATTAVQAPVASESPPPLPPPPPPRVAPPPSQGQVVISVPPLSPTAPRAGYHVHDGFYLRLAAGLGGGRINVSAPAGASSFGAGGAGLALDLWVGGTPWRGVTLGGMAAVQTLHDSNTVVEGSSTDLGTSGGTFLVGPYVDVFPDPLRGLHLGGALALSAVRLNGDSHSLAVDRGVRDFDGRGLGASLWMGYMAWVGPEWSLGGMLKLSGFATGEEAAGLERKSSGYSLSVSVTALCH